MGRVNAEGMAEAVTEGMVSLEQALTYHLQFNHYPPVDVAWVPVCLGIVERWNEGDDDLSYEVANPIREGDRRLAREVVEALHLDSFLLWED